MGAITGLLLAKSAAACGVSGPDGALSCSLAEHERETELKWHVGVAGIYTSTRLRFSDDIRAGLLCGITERLSLLAEGIPLGERAASAGASFAF